MSAFDREDVILLLLAIDLLDQCTRDELAQARQQCNSAKQGAMINMRSRMIIVRGKLRTMQQVGP